jgi:hypothetical protein
VRLPVMYVSNKHTVELFLDAVVIQLLVSYDGVQYDNISMIYAPFTEKSKRAENETTRCLGFEGPVT